MPFNINGLPDTVAVAGTLSTKANEIKGISIEESSIGLGRALKNTLTQLTGAGLAVISVIGRKLWVSDSDEYFNAAVGACAPSDDGATITAAANQDGTSLEWDYAFAANMPGGPTGAIATAIKDLLDPKPVKYTVDGLIAALARVLPDGYAPYIMVDQASAAVKLGFLPTGDQEATDAAIDAITPKPTNRAEVTLEAVEGPVGNSSLPFEGGSTSV